MAYSISHEGINLIKHFEGLKLEAYQDVADIWTIGYGHTGPDVHPGQVITEEEAERLLRKDVNRFERGVRDAVKVSMVQAQFDALVSFSFNVGLGALRKSTALKRLNKGNYEGAADALTWWNKARINGQLEVVSGLARRRAAEAALFLRDLDQLDTAPPTPDHAGAEVKENPPRRSNPLASRTTTGAATSGAAGAAGAGAVLFDGEEGQTAQPTDGDTPTAPATDAETDTESESAPESDSDSDTQTTTEVPADDPTEPSQEDLTDAIVIACGVLAIIAAVYVIAARLDDWFQYRR